MAFVHLHTHSEYSLLDGANRIPDLLARVQQLGMDSLAITDHGNLHCAWSFYEEAKARKIRPILGFEDRKSTRLNSSHSQISYAVFCLKKKKTTKKHTITDTQ